MVSSEPVTTHFDGKSKKPTNQAKCESDMIEPSPSLYHICNVLGNSSPMW
jgi:hypothetical protein